MSFAGEIKDELASKELSSASLNRARAYGLFLFGGEFSDEGLLLRTESCAAAQLYQRYLEEYAGLGVPVRRQGRGYIVSMTDREAAERLLSAFGHQTAQVSLRINLRLLDNRKSAACFLAGAFLACGGAIDPAKGYRIEFLSDRFFLSRDLADLLENGQFESKLGSRRGGHVVYLKESEQIEDLLTLMGASKSAMRMMDVKIYRDVRNKVNRVINCETANLNKMVAASAAQREDILYIERACGLGSLPPELQELAQLRLDYPDASLKELCEMMPLSISRSGVSHRLRRISRFARELREEGQCE